MRTLLLVAAATNAASLARHSANEARRSISVSHVSRGGWPQAAEHSAGLSDGSLPAAVVFDLDGCVWSPDMYMLWGGGAPFTGPDDDGNLADSRGQRVRMLGAIPEILSELKTDPKWKDTFVAVASCTDEPDWAQECMRKFQLKDGLCMKDVWHMEEIHKGNKQGHLKNIASQTGVPLGSILFLDNERGNCIDVAAIGVTVAYTPQGVTADAWARALERFPAPGEIITA